jgi:phenylalanyl-tRNA synthetase beta chain
VHPALAEEGVRLGLERMAAWSGGQIAEGLVDAYPKPAVDPQVEITPADVRRLLGITLTPQEIAALLVRLEFNCQVQGERVLVQTPPHRLDIGEGVIGQADVMEEIARLYGYNNIPTTHLAEVLPVQRGNPSLEGEERIKDILVSLGLQEVIAVRQTHPDREARLLSVQSAGETPYVRLANPITPERSVMRRSVLASVVEIAEKNSRVRERLALFELGQCFLPVEGERLPAEPTRLAIVLAGLVEPASWDRASQNTLDFFDLKGMIEALLEELHLPKVTFEPAEHPSFHPGKCAVVKSGEKLLGIFGELHPLVKARFDFVQLTVVAADLDVEAILSLAPATFDMLPVPAYPPILEDIAIIVDEDIPAAQIEALIRQTGGKVLRDLRLFDIFRGAQIGEGKKSMAYSLTYQSSEKTLNDQDAAQIRNKIVRRLEQELGAKLRAG